ncbi:hypothetical protein ARMSODRAFT_1058087 [Armillaria solidipes]|uniref:Uncharacterized protein n=1 Tax=Armillaria solidipes TaxID=1076256 RepID=A0A2H3AX49_9AGAR|nr:hypothetical protein ARMSODRAFT_1058087 [Armillaria solidipes]
MRPNSPVSLWKVFSTVITVVLDCIQFAYQPFRLGFYLITSFSCFRELLTSDGSLKSGHTINYKMVAASLWLLVFSTLYVACHLRFILDAFIYSSGEPIDTFRDMSHPVNVMLLVTFVAQTFMGDCILLYRCWVIYGRQWMVVICPVIMCIAEIGCGIAGVCIETSLGRDSSITNPSIFPLILTHLSLTLATNVITTSLIVHRIWTVHSAVRQVVPSIKNNPLRNALVVVIESASVYTVSAVVLLVVYAIGSDACYVMTGTIVQIIGITFNLIIIRFARGTAVKSMEETITSLRVPPRRVGQRVAFQNSRRPWNDIDTQTTHDNED